jgi:hypothetical protein
MEFDMANMLTSLPCPHLRCATLYFTVLMTGVLATLLSAETADAKQIFSCKEALSVVKGAGYRNIKTESCAIPYVFSGRRDDCTFVINVRADGRWIGFQVGCNTIILDSFTG